MINLDKLDALCEAATVGEWYANWHGGDLTLPCAIVTDAGYRIAKMSPTGSIIQTEANAAFIAASRQAVPELVAEVKRLRAERLRDTAKEAEDD